MRALDTDVCIEILRGNRRVIQRRRETLDQVGTTWITAAELYYGAAKSGDPDDKTLAVSEFLRTLEVLSIDDEAARQFGRLKAELELSGQLLADADLFIGSICLAREAVLVTGNLGHYSRIPGLNIEDWMRGP